MLYSPPVHLASTTEATLGTAESIDCPEESLVVTVIDCGCLRLPISDSCGTRMVPCPHYILFIDARLMVSPIRRMIPAHELPGGSLGLLNNTFVLIRFILSTNREN